VQHECAFVGNATAVGGVVAADGGVVQRERPVVYNAAAADLNRTIGDSHAGEDDGRAAVHRENAVIAPRVAPHGQAIGPGALQVDVVAQAGQGAGQVDGAGDAEGDGVVIGVGIGLADAVAQVARQAGPRPGIGQAIDHEVGGDGPV